MQVLATTVARTPDIKVNLNQNTKTLQDDKNLKNNLVSDVNLAKSSFLGYGVDKDGFFTSDFNKAASLPKSYKINKNKLKDAFATFDVFTKKINNFAFLNTHSTYDPAKTLGRFYKLFSKLDKDSVGVIYDQNTLEIYKSYTNKDDFLKDTMSEGGKMNESKIEEKYDYKSVPKGFKKDAGGLFDFISSNGFYMKDLVGKTTIAGKIMGLDPKISKEELKDFQSFMAKHEITHTAGVSSTAFNDGNFDPAIDGIDFDLSVSAKDTPFGEAADKLRKDYEDALTSDNLSLDDFKAKWLDFKKRNDDLVKKIDDYHKNHKTAPKINAENKPTESKEIKAFKAIQGSSDNKSYEDTDISRYFFIKFLKATKANGTDIMKLLEAMNKKIDKRI